MQDTAVTAVVIEQYLHNLHCSLFL